MDHLVLYDSNGKFVVWTQTLSVPLIVAQLLAESAIRTEPFKITSIADASTVQVSTGKPQYSKHVFYSR